jgi:tetratricopeptide (TPR) repeat protein
MSLFEKFRKQPPASEPPPVTYEHTFQAGLAAMRQGHKAAARELLRRVADGVPQDRDSCHALGVSYFGEDDAEAVKWFAKVLQRSEANDELRAHTLAFLAQCFLKMGDRKQAVTCLRGLHVLRPELAEELAESLGLLNG